MENENSPSFPTSLTPYPDRGISVLLIDDQAMVAEAVRRLLASEKDIAFSYCDQPANAIYQAIATEPTVILLDLVMPGADGIDLTRQLRSHPATTRVPIIVLSTKEEPQIKSDAFAAGADDYLIKLPDKIELVARIRSHSRAFLNLIYTDAVLEGLRENQGHLLASNAALIASNAAVQAARDEAEEARREAVRANTAKSEFFSRMSHELRTPLNAILGFAQLLELADLPSEHRNSVQYILQGGRYLLELINEVLDIARIEAGRLELSLEPVALLATLEATLTLIRPQAARKAIVIDVAPIDKKVFVMADRQRLSQVLLNLFSNAVKYNSQPGEIFIRCERPDAGRLRICVRDTGAGIAADQLAHLFVPFERLGAEQSSVEGSGLGLALAKTLAEAMGGTLGVESTPGRGCTFWLELAETEHPAKRLSAEGEAFDSPAPAFGASGAEPESTILYIEDNVANFAFIEAVLVHRPAVRLLKATRGQEGLELARSHRPDLILLDLHLPDFSGLDVLNALQRDRVIEDIPVIVLSADAGTSQRDRLLAAGARCYLTKPLVVKRVLDAIDQVLVEGAQGRILGSPAMDA